MQTCLMWLHNTIWTTRFLEPDPSIYKSQLVLVERSKSVLYWWRRLFTWESIWSFRLNFMGQRGHGNCGSLPHSSLRCLFRVIFHLYCLPQCGQSCVGDPGKGAPGCDEARGGHWGLTSQDEEDRAIVRFLAHKRPTLSAKENQS